MLGNYFSSGRAPQHGSLLAQYSSRYSRLCIDVMDPLSIMVCGAALVGLTIQLVDVVISLKNLVEKLKGASETKDEFLEQLETHRVVLERLHRLLKEGLSSQVEETSALANAAGRYKHYLDQLETRVKPLLWDNKRKRAWSSFKLVLHEDENTQTLEKLDQLLSLFECFIEMDRRYVTFHICVDDHRSLKRPAPSCYVLQRTCLRSSKT